MLSLLDDTFLWIDNSLSPRVAEALKLVDYNAHTVFDVPDFAKRPDAPDPEIIDWLAQFGGVWIHADDQARREHRKLILARSIRTLWVYRPRGKMASYEQLRVLAYVLPDLLDRFGANRKERHYQAEAFGHPPKTRVRLKAVAL